MRSRDDAPQTLHSDLARLRARLASAVAAQPFAAAATAAGIGFALGGGWTAARLALLLQAGSRAAMTWLGAAVGERGTEKFDEPH